MTRATSWIAFALATTILAGRGASEQPWPTVVPEPSSHANVTAFVTRHLVLDLTANFDQRTLAGTAELHLIRRDATAELVLDTRDLAIEKVEATAGTNLWVKTSFKLDQPNPAFGSALRIVMPRGAERVRVTYATSRNARGLLWLSPAQTAGQRHPFLFTNPWAINARSFIPLQDLPGLRMTYEAVIRTPPELVAVMAAEMHSSVAGSGVFKFHMPQAIPSYLIALAIGDLTFKAMSPRTGVWAEPSVVETAAREFADAEEMAATTESLYGPYRWGRYDLLVMPPSFPFGGVEQARDTWLSGGPMSALASIARAWSTHEWIHFVAALPRTLTLAQVRALDDQFAFTKSPNASIAQVWFRLAIATRHEPAYSALEEYMIHIGRRRLIVPLYRDLASTPEGKTRASQIFAKAREGYHPIVQTTVAELLR